MPMMAVSPSVEALANTSADSDDETPTVDRWVEGAGRLLPLPPEEDSEEEEGNAPQETVVGANTAQPSQQYAELVFADSRPAPAPPNEMFDVPYVEVNRM